MAKKKKKLPPGVKRSLQRRVASPKELSKEEKRRKSELKRWTDHPE